MAATVEMRQSGANSATFFTFSDGGDPTIDAEYWEQLPPGRLRTLMTTTYDSYEEFYRAFADEGGMISGFGEYDNDPGVPGIEFNGLPNTPRITVLGENPTIVRIALAYSASE